MSNMSFLKGLWKGPGEASRLHEYKVAVPDKTRVAMTDDELVGLAMPGTFVVGWPG